jgi:glutamate/tyrosine decarboxylase-like PLP-dependent enzyme
VRRLGVGAGPPLTAYAPATVHDTIQRAADMIGLGHDAVRVVPVDARDHVDVGAMRSAIEADLDGGLRPICVVGTAGTVGTGAIDDLAAIADVADAFDLWFHVDGAVGAVGALVDPLRHRFTGIERADSVGLDPHAGWRTPGSAERHVLPVFRSSRKTQPGDQGAPLLPQGRQWRRTVLGLSGTPNLPLPSCHCH